MYWIRAIFAVVCLLIITYYQITKEIPTRLDPNQAPKSRNGLVPVGGNDSPARANGVDIIFVHGLGSNPDSTWQKKAEPHENATQDSARPVDWVSDFVYNDIPPSIRPNVRVYFYNYDSYWKKDAVNTRLTKLGDELLEWINGEIRGSDAERSRHLIFVGHSYGGLVVKQALVRAQSHQEFSYVAKQTKGVLFLGTPHRGSSFSSWGWLVAQFLWPLGSNPSILADLDYDSIWLRDLHASFADIPWKDLLVFNFYEQRATKLFQLWFVRIEQFCVREQSATYDGSKVRNIGLPVDHSGLNKFGSRCDNYRTIHQKLVEAVNHSTSSVKHIYAVPVERVHTFTERPAISKEIEEKLQIRHDGASVPYAIALVGLGGAGKSQLALDYAEKHKSRYNPIFWIDAIDEEAARSSFKGFAVELGLPATQSCEESASVFTDPDVRAVIQWLRHRSEADDEWLVIIDNADDLSWGIQRILPKGNKGTIIITSRDSQSVQLIVQNGCEEVRVGDMLPEEGTALLLRYLGLKPELASRHILESCERIIQRLGHLALAIGLAGAYIGTSASTPELALTQYLVDYERHCDELLQMEDFYGLQPTQQTVWTVWDTTLEKITRDHSRLRPDLLLVFLAHFKGSIIQNEVFRLASLGVPKLEARLALDDDEKPPDLIRQYIAIIDGVWDGFSYRRACEILLRYNLLQKSDGEWPGVMMHSLVQWRALQGAPTRPWWWWHTMLLAAACEQNLGERNFRLNRHLLMHIPATKENSFYNRSGIIQQYVGRLLCSLGDVYIVEDRIEEAEWLWSHAVEIEKAIHGNDHPNTLTAIHKLAIAYSRQGRLREAEELALQVLGSSQMQLGVSQVDILCTMEVLASTYAQQGRLEEAEVLYLRVIEYEQLSHGLDHSHSLLALTWLVSRYMNQCRLKDAEELALRVLETQETRLEFDHPDTLHSLYLLALIDWHQGRCADVSNIYFHVTEARRVKLSPNHPDKLSSIIWLVERFMVLGKWKEAEELWLQVAEDDIAKHEVDHVCALYSLENLATTYYMQCRLIEAEELCAQILEAQIPKIGLNHHSTLFSIYNLAKTYWNRGQVEPARDLCVRIAEAYGTKIQADLPNTSTTSYNSIFDWNQMIEGITPMMPCCQVWQDLLGPVHAEAIAEALRLSCADS